MIKPPKYPSGNYSVSQLRQMLPNVGDRLVRVPNVNATTALDNERKPRTCQVIYVNRQKLWYMVRFQSGRTDTYKAPE